MPSFDPSCWAAMSVENPIRAAVLDFDGAVCPADVTEALLIEFGDPSWWDVEQEMRRQSATLRDALVRQAALLRGDPDEWLDYAVSKFALEATFAPFVRWADDQGITLAIASDGLGFYIEPMLRASGIDDVEDIEVRTNVWRADGGFGFPFGHARCVGCGTCKMNAVLDRRDAGGAVAFVGEGYSDRYGALYADVTFAKGNLVRMCVEDGVAYVPWETYDDVREGLSAIANGDGTAPVTRPPPAPARCPGWMETGR